MKANGSTMMEQSTKEWLCHFHENENEKSQTKAQYISTVLLDTDIVYVAYSSQQHYIYIYIYLCILYMQIILRSMVYFIYIKFVHITIVKKYSLLSLYNIPCKIGTNL